MVVATDDDPNDLWFRSIGSLVFGLCPSVLDARCSLVCVWSVQHLMAKARPRGALHDLGLADDLVPMTTHTKSIE